LDQLDVLRDDLDEHTVLHTTDGSIRRLDGDELRRVLLESSGAERERHRSAQRIAASLLLCRWGPRSAQIW
jgi:adenylylsulfate kinase-like enzyme